MNKSKRKYARSCKQKMVTFYKHDADLLAYASTINFQAFVKNALRNALQFGVGKVNKNE